MTELTIKVDATEIKEHIDRAIVFTVPRVWGEILAERAAQDAKWGGPEHDDLHQPGDWAELIRDRGTDVAIEAYKLEDGEPNAYRRRLVQVAALAVAALASFDRQQQEVDHG